MSPLNIYIYKVHPLYHRMSRRLFKKQNQKSLRGKKIVEGWKKKICQNGITCLIVCPVVLLRRKTKIFEGEKNYFFCQKGVHALSRHAQWSACFMSFLIYIYSLAKTHIIFFCQKGVHALLVKCCVCLVSFHVSSPQTKKNKNRKK